MQRETARCSVLTVPATSHDLHKCVCPSLNASILVFRCHRKTNVPESRGCLADMSLHLSAVYRHFGEGQKVRTDAKLPQIDSCQECLEGPKEY